MKIFVLTKKSGPFLDPFCPKFGHFHSKNQVFGYFLGKRTSVFSKTWLETDGQLLWIIKWQCCVWKNTCFGRFGHFWVKIHCIWWHINMVLGCFWSFSSKLLMIFCQFLLFKLCLLFKNGQWNFLFWQKTGPFLSFLVQNLAIFVQKPGFQTFSSKPLIRFV